MDIQSLKEFEAWWFENYDRDDFEDVVFSEILNEYESNYIVTDDLNKAWSAWQAAKAQAVPAEKNWDEIHLNPKERLYWSLRSAKKRKSDLNWYHASHQTCVGSTHGRKICEYLGVDPDGKDFVRKQEPTND